MMIILHNQEFLKCFTSIGYHSDRILRYTSSIKRNIFVRGYSDNEIVNEFLFIRSNNPRYTFNDYQISLIRQAFDSIVCGFNSNASFISPDPIPSEEYEDKESDAFMIRL